jgi:hypothetical protein
MRYAVIRSAGGGASDCDVRLAACALPLRCNMKINKKYEASLICIIDVCNGGATLSPRANELTL